MSALKNLEGKKFGLLTVISRHGRSARGVVTWKCRCDCGGEAVVNGCYLKSGDTKSCGCLRGGEKNKKDIIGEKFGRLTVIREDGRNKHQNVCWVCLCDCGATTRATTAKLIGGRVRSCGCLRSEILVERARARRIFQTRAEMVNSFLKKSSVLFGRIPLIDSPSIINGDVYVSCKNCGKLFRPTYQQAQLRTGSFYFGLHGENNFYCSDSCKDKCPVFNHKSNHPDPRISTPTKARRKTRSCQTKNLKQLQCDETGGQSYCERCGDLIDVELHHTLPVSKYGKEAICPAGHILLCFGCHLELHRECA